MAHELAVDARRQEVADRRRPGHRAPTATSSPAGPSRTTSSAGPRGEAGAVSAEAAAVLPVLALVCVALLWLVSLAVTHVKVVDAARETARAVARGEQGAGEVGSGPTDVSVRVTRHGERIEVVASGTVRGPGGVFAGLGPVRLSSTAWSLEEPR